jgi:phage-related protein
VIKLAKIIELFIDSFHCYQRLILLFCFKLSTQTYISSQKETQFGPALGRPYTESMGEGLFEIRAKGKEGIGRSLFCTLKGKEIVILHSFIKKTKKTPNRELKLARKRMKEVKS